MPKRLADHLDRDTTVLGSGSPRMAQRVGSDGEVETQPLCQGFQAVVESPESGLVFTVGSLILPLLITVKNAEKVVGTAGTGRLPVPELVEHLLCTCLLYTSHKQEIENKIFVVIHTHIPNWVVHQQYSHNQHTLFCKRNRIVYGLSLIHIYSRN